MDTNTESLLVSTCLALGGFEDQSENVDDVSKVYVMGDECLECLKDIKKFVKYYEEAGDNVALTFLGKMGILEKDLIPILLLNSPADNSTKERLVLACIELMVPMTWIIDYDELKKLAIAEEDNSLVGNLYEKIEILRGYKRAFLQPGVLSAIFAVLLRPLEVEYRLRTSRDVAIIRLGLSLFRNLVAIQDGESSLGGSMDQFISSIMQDQLLERFEQENILALLVTLASSSQDAQLAEWNALTLEIFYHIFTGIDPEELLPAVVSSTGSVRNSKLEELLQKEEKEKKSQSTAGRKRHDRFGTTGEARLADGRRIVLHQKGALFTSIENQLDSVKKPKAKPKRQKELDDYKKTLSKSGTELLRNLALTMLESCFNPLFTSIRRDIELGRDRIKPYHQSQYHVLMAFMLRFRRVYVDNLIKQPRQNKKDILEHDMKRLADMLKTLLRNDPERLQELKTIVEAQDWEKLQQLSDRALTSQQYRVYEGKKDEILRVQMEKVMQLEEEYQKSVAQWDYDLVATAVEKTSVFHTIRYLRGKVEDYPKEAWGDKRKAMDCFQEMLVTLSGMYKSLNEQYRDASDNVQSNLYYEDGTLELFLDLVRGYTTQSNKYLMTLIRMNHILLKTLETYSQEKSFIARNKKMTVRKKKKKPVPSQEDKGEDGTQQEENQDGQTADQEGQPVDGVQEGETQPEAEDGPNSDHGSDDESLPKYTFKEHKFFFKDFERRYACDAVVATYLTYLDTFQELNETQLRWVAAMFHRVAVNCSNLSVFYKATTLYRFNQILDSDLVDPKGDISKVIYYIVRQFFKKLEVYPLLIVDIFAPKTSKFCLELNVGRIEAEKDTIEMPAKKKKRLMETELEVDPDRPEEEQIKEAVIVLYYEDKAELVEWAIEILKDSIAKREIMTFRSEKELDENPDLMYSVEGVEDIPIDAITPARKQSLLIERRLRQLFTLIKFTRDDSGGEIKFKIPKDLPTDTMAHYLEVIESVEEFSPEEGDFDALISEINSSKKKKASSGDGSSKKRGPYGSRVLTEKEVAVYKSAEWVLDSDDYDEDDDVIFEREKEQRIRTLKQNNAATDAKEKENAEKERAKAEKKRADYLAKRGAAAVARKGATNGEEDEYDEEPQEEGSIVGTSKSSVPPSRKATVSLDTDTESDSDIDDDRRPPPKTASAVDSDSDGDSDEDDDDDKPSQATPARARSAAAVAQSRRLVALDSDDEDEDEDEDDEDQTIQQSSAQPRTLSQINKRRIIHDDDENEDDDRDAAQESPAKKRHHTFEE
ncbi:Topoisomerase 1-associated factor 1 [Mortierella sp. NVP41]|nr:Topoisomerase 1-associated factor 1 [Mortierella sp. NVP41]